MLNYLKAETNRTFTENGTATYKSTNSHCLDLFATIWAIRDASDAEIIKRFADAFIENRDLAMKILFFGRDVRGGLGERRVFRVIIHWLAQNNIGAIQKNIKHIPEYGRYDDLFALMGTTCEKKVIELIKEQLEKDMVAKEDVSLLAKWLPSINASNKETIQLGKNIAKKLGLSEANYRKTLVALRKKIQLIENNLREQDYNFDYAKQPSKAMFKYRKAFIRNVLERYEEFLIRVAKGEAIMHTGTLTPYDILDHASSVTALITKN